VELVGPPSARQLARDLVDSFGDDERGSIHRLREEVAHWTVETAREEDALAVLGDEGKGAPDIEDGVEVTSEQPSPRFRFVDSPEPLGFTGDEIDDSRDWQVLVHEKNILPEARPCH
jgi:hypothetical protein